MDTALYVNTVGALVNDSTKYTVNIDEVSVTNIVLLDHLQYVIDTLPNEYDKFPEEFKDKNPQEDIVKKLEGYIHCLKKQMNFYESKVISEDCILTELDGNIKIE